MLERILRLREAKRHAKRGHFRDAFAALESPALNGHRDALDLRTRLFAQLIDQARTALENQDLPAARDALTTARAAGCTSEEGAQLMTRLTDAERQASSDQRARKQILGEVRDRMAAGSIVGAHERLEKLAPTADHNTDEMRRWVESETQDLDRHLARCREALESEDGSGASEAWRRAAARFPTNPDVIALRGQVRALNERQALDRVLARIKSRSDAISAVQDLLRDYPHQATNAHIQRFLARTEKELRNEAAKALERSEPDAALRVLEPIASEDAVAALVSAIRLWVRARELARTGYPARAVVLLRTAAETIDAKTAIGRELTALERSVKVRAEALGRVTTQLEAGEHAAAVSTLDEMLADGTGPEWLQSLRREVGSQLDAGQAALLEARKRVDDGATRDARSTLIPLLSRRETRTDALALWRTVEEREQRAATLLGEAEGILYRPERERSALADAKSRLDEAKRLQSDHPQLTEVEERLDAAITARDAHDSALDFVQTKQLDQALERCDAGLAADPTNRALSKLRERTAAQHAAALLDEAERQLTSPHPVGARRLVDRALAIVPAGSPDASRAHAVLRTLGPAADLTGAAPTIGGQGAPITPNAPPEPDASDRFMIRVEEGPEALVLTKDEIRIGNARDPQNDVALMANISTNHAKISRAMSFHGGIAYTIRVADGKTMRINGETRRETEIVDGDRIELGQDVVLRVHFPDRGSVTMLLWIERGYHIEDIKAVLLLKGPGKDGRIRIGSGEKVHLRTTNAAGLADLYLNDDQDEAAPRFVIESEQGLEVDGRYHRNATVCNVGAYVRSGECRFQIGRFVR